MISSDRTKLYTGVELELGLTSLVIFGKRENEVFYFCFALFQAEENL